MFLEPLENPKILLNNGAQGKEAVGTSPTYWPKYAQNAILNDAFTFKKSQENQPNSVSGAHFKHYFTSVYDLLTFGPYTDTI